MKGIVLWYSERDRNGIILDEYKNEYYVDVSVLKNAEKLDRNDHVEFIPHRLHTCLCAKDVSLNNE